MRMSATCDLLQRCPRSTRPIRICCIQAPGLAFPLRPQHAKRRDCSGQNLKGASAGFVPIDETTLTDERLDVDRGLLGLRQSAKIVKKRKNQEIWRGRGS